MDKNSIKLEKTLYCNYKKLCFLKNKGLESAVDEYENVLKIQF